jgi:predicted O-methyltransferase YrrM
LHRIEYFTQPRMAIKRLISEWELRRPRRGPAYSLATPRVEGSSELETFFPLNAPTLAAGAMSTEAADFVMSVLAKLTPSSESEQLALFYKWGRAKYGSYWRYADIATTLRASAVLLKPRAYLEIGVRRGRSAAIVAATCPKCDVYGFDMWVPGYGDADNPGSEFVQRELRAVGYQGNATLISGDSAATVPKFLSQHPDLYFDLITVDGDHSVRGAATDLINTLPRLKVGGVVVFDDIATAPLLARVWRKLVRSDSRFESWEFASTGYGVACATRITDKKHLASLS